MNWLELVIDLPSLVLGLGVSVFMMAAGLWLYRRGTRWALLVIVAGLLLALDTVLMVALSRLWIHLLISGHYVGASATPLSITGIRVIEHGSHTMLLSAMWICLIAVSVVRPAPSAAVPLRDDDDPPLW